MDERKDRRTEVDFWQKKHYEQCAAPEGCALRGIYFFYPRGKRGTVNWKEVPKFCSEHRHLATMETKSKRG